MICYHCNKIGGCPTFQTLYSMSNDFCINNCNDYDEASQYKYRKIAEYDELMHAVYDYFTNNLPDDITEKEAKKAITNAMCGL